MYLCIHLAQVLHIHLYLMSANPQFTSSTLAEIDQKVAEWLALDRNESSRQEIECLHKLKDYNALSKKLLHRISFGTAGLRSSMEPGFAHMNDVTILQASQGLIAYLLKNVAHGTEPSIVIGYDHRHHSQRFAELTASVAVVSGLKVYYLGSVDRLSPELDSLRKTCDYTLTVHTPMVPFTIKHFGASAGVMVTASHNPAKDNGYKVYYGNGCQIIPPHDVGIAASIDSNLSPWLDKNVWDVTENFTAGLESGRLIAVHADMTKSYVEAIKNELIAPDASVSFPFVYTPMHGVGRPVFAEICRNFGGKAIQFADVEEQQEPDPEFPSVRFPNPEEKGALDHAIAKAKKIGARFVIANDPDADRFSAAFQCKDSTWRQLTGNEIGALFASFVLEIVRNGGSLGSNPALGTQALKETYFLNSTVSSQLMKAMAAKEGFNYQDTLTGFKWIGNKALDLKKQGFFVPFGYEEAIGYMFTLVDDKDGISAAIVFLQLCQRWFADGAVTPDEKLQQIYESYGWFKECNGYYKLDDVSKTEKIFTTIRSSFEPGLYPQKIGDLKVLEWRDLTIGFDSKTLNNKPILPTDSSSQMITALVEDSESRIARFTCRGSGTEPKLKVYIEGKSDKSEADAVTIARHCWKMLETNWFHPEKNGLEVVV